MKFAKHVELAMLLVSSLIFKLRQVMIASVFSEVINECTTFLPVQSLSPEAASHCRYELRQAADFDLARRAS